MRRTVTPSPAASLLLAVFVALQAFDYVTTTVGMKLGAAETNPLIAPIAGNWFALLIVKLAVTLFACRLLRGRTLALAFIACAYLLVGINNVLVIARLL
jgi:hypothetical protein